MKAHRLQSPFAHWRVGLAVEVVAIGLFITVVFATVAVLVSVL